MIHRGFIFTVRRELLRMTRYKTFSFSIVILPIITFIFLAIVFYHGVPSDLPIAVLDRDNTSLSRQVSRMVDAGQYVKVDYKISSLEEGREMIKKGLIDAVLVLPEDMERDIMRGEQVKPALFINGVNLLIGSLVEKDITTTMQSFSVGIEIQKLQTQGIPEDIAYEMAMPISFEKHILFNPYVSYAYYLLPGFMPMMLLFFVILSSVFAVGIELKKGTASKWLSGANGNIATAITAKLLPYTCLFVFLSLIMNGIMYRFFGVPHNGNIPLLILGNFLFILAYQWMGVLLVALLDNLRLALSIAAGYSVLAFTFSGLTFPFMAMNPDVSILGNLFPFTFYMNLFIDQAMRGAPIVHSLPYISFLCLFIMIPMLFLKRLRKLCVNERYWGKI